MSPNYLSIIITHGSLGCCLKKVTEKLIVPSTELHCYSNQADSLETIEAEIAKLKEKFNPEKIIIFTDLMGGSCWLSANKIKKANPDFAVISGVNVQMLVSYFMNYSRFEWSSLLEKITADAIKGIVCR